MDTASHCLYRNKVCHLPRALKKNGQLHSLCEFHRVKANLNQRRLEKKKKIRKDGDAATPPAARAGCKELWVDPASSEDEEAAEAVDHVIWAEPIRLSTP
ncbi:hypothetical protein ACHHYP_06164 [Achlya hypogyna]|uniref:Uncharacterized protein n=1 Tax=Achlya hypogyna TaxID=1202772 RepID=A0A1V9ZN83_ACHHY|nr:hypothetical protein ACHHYP_06164 [Achlya hypogyna]